MGQQEYEKRRTIFGAASGLLFAFSAITEGAMQFLVREEILQGAAPTLTELSSAPAWLSPLLIAMTCIAMPAVLGVFVGLIGVAFERGRRLIAAIAVAANIAMICSAGALAFKSEPAQPCTSTSQCISGSKTVCDLDKKVCVEP